MNRLVSIITPSHNSSKFIEECIDSVISQKYIFWEMIIVDDASTDDTRNIIDKYLKVEERIRAIYLKENVGAAEARNIALRSANGRYIAFLDSDDIWRRDKLEKQLSFMKKKKIVFSFTSYSNFYKKNKDFSVIKAPLKMTYDSYLKNTIIGCLTVIIDREKTGDFEMPDIRSSHDMALWLLIMKRGFNAYGLDQNLARYRVSSSSNTSNKLKAAYDVWIVYRDLEKLDMIYSVWCFVNYVFHAIRKRII